MSQPAICPGCQRIVIIKKDQAVAACKHCGHETRQPTKSSKSDSVSLMGPGKSTKVSGSSKMSEEMKWSLIMIVAGIAFMIWGLISPETTVKRRSWSSGPGTPVGWAGGFFFTIGVIGTIVMGLLSKKENG